MLNAVHNLSFSVKGDVTLNWTGLREVGKLNRRSSLKHNVGLLETLSGIFVVFHPFLGRIFEFLCEFISLRCIPCRICSCLRTSNLLWFSKGRALNDAINIVFKAFLEFFLIGHTHLSDLASLIDDDHPGCAHEVKVIESITHRFLHHVKVIAWIEILTFDLVKNEAHVRVKWHGAEANLTSPLFTLGLNDVVHSLDSCNRFLVGRVPEHEYERLVGLVL